MIKETTNYRVSIFRPLDQMISFEEGPDFECDLEKQLEKINNPSTKPYKNRC